MLGGLLEQHLHFLSGHFDPASLANFGQQQAQPDPAHGDRAVIVLLVLDFLQRGGGIFFVLGFLLELGPDLLEFGFDHAGGHVEIVIGRQQVEQRALHLGAGLPGAFLLELAAQQALKLVERFETERLGEIIIGSACARDFDGLDGDVESGGLTLEVFGRIVIREGHGDGLFIACLGADQLFFEARNEPACAQFQRGIAGGAAVKGYAIDLAGEIDDQLIAVFRFLALLGIDKSLGARG